MFYLSPSVNVRELDLSTVVPAVATSIAAIAGEFQWGPCFDKKLITNEKELIDMFGEPNDTVALHWFSAANFLKYGNSLYVARAVDAASALNAGIGCEEDAAEMGQVAASAYLQMMIVLKLILLFLMFIQNLQWLLHLLSLLAKLQLKAQLQEQL